VTEGGEAVEDVKPEKVEGWKCETFGSRQLYD